MCISFTAIGSDDIASGSGDGAAPEVGDGAAPEGGDDSAPKGGDGTAPGSGDGTVSNNSEEGGIDIPSVERQTESNTTTSSQSNSSDYTAQSLDFDLASMLRISGWQLHDRSQTNQTTTLLDCTFDGIKCNSKVRFTLFWPSFIVAKSISLYYTHVSNVIQFNLTTISTENGIFLKVLFIKNVCL